MSNHDVIRYLRLSLRIKWSENELHELSRPLKYRPITPRVVDKYSTSKHGLGGVSRFPMVSWCRT